MAKEVALNLRKSDLEKLILGAMVSVAASIQAPFSKEAAEERLFNTSINRLMEILNIFINGGQITTDQLEPYFRANV